MCVLRLIKFAILNFHAKNRFAGRIVPFFASNAKISVWPENPGGVAWRQRMPWYFLSQRCSTKDGIIRPAMILLHVVVT